MDATTVNLRNAQTPPARQGKRGPLSPTSSAGHWEPAPALPAIEPPGGVCRSPWCLACRARRGWFSRLLAMFTR